MKQKILKTNIVNKLEEDIVVNKEYYINMKKNPNWLIKMFEESGNNNYEMSSKIEVEPFVLKEGGPETDCENAKTVYSHLKDLKPVQAVSNELWTYMTHIQFAKYMSIRWSVNNSEKEQKLKNVITQRYFARRSSKGIVRNGIARLWWAGYWCYDEQREDPYELIEVIFDKQETYEHISERSYNRNKNILIASLEAIKENNFNSIQIRELYGKINSYGSDKHLDALDIDESRKMINEILEEIKKNKPEKEKKNLKDTVLEVISKITG